MPSSYLWAFSSHFHGDRCCLARRVTALAMPGSRDDPSGVLLDPVLLFCCWSPGSCHLHSCPASCHAPHWPPHRALFSQLSKEMAGQKYYFYFILIVFFYKSAASVIYENLSVIMEKTTSSCNGSLFFSCLLFAGQNGISCLCCFHVFFLLTSCSSCNCWHNS